jgi:hypothetical protein
MYKKTEGNPFSDNYQRPNMALGDITPKQLLAMVA